MTERYIASDDAKCAGNPLRYECDDCLRKILPVHPKSTRQLWLAVWMMGDPCPSRWVENEENNT